MTIEWTAPIQYAKKIGPRRAESLNKEGIVTVGDLLLYPPFRYEDRTRFRKINILQEGETACVFGKILAASSRTTPRAKVKLYDMVVRDETGALNVVFFNQPYLRDLLKEGRHVVLYGKAERDKYSFAGRFQFANPAFEVMDEEGDEGINTGRIVPVYRKLGDLTAKQLRGVIYHLLPTVANVPEHLPETILAKRNLLPRLEALRRIHFPVVADPDEAEREKELAELNAATTIAHRRMVYEEFFLLQAGLQSVAQGRKKVQKPHRIEITDAIRAVVRRTLPFKPTAAQKRVIAEIVADLKSPWPMNRLLQGDVGSGKTIVAVQAMIVAVENGCQAALMAPTEILAEQHYRSLAALLAHTNYRIVLLKSALPSAEKEEIKAAVASGAVKIVVGTHSVIQRDVTFNRLALVVVDEQHRFGVLQRAELMRKGREPDILVMTATPIPRTLALTVYGDLTLSIIDEMPPGRIPPKTLLLRGERELKQQGYELIRRELARGNQAYVVYPLIEESEKSDLRHAKEGFRDLSRDVFSEYPVGLLHGRMDDAEKNKIMEDFRTGAVRVLVSTTVIEVGIDVPQATVMLVEHAERFGLSQLHQLRGRVGRGKDPSWCVLVAHDLKTDEARRRLEVMVETTDGFRIAEEDLALRGPGEFAGTRQSGVLNFRFGSLIRHRPLMEEARADATEFVARAMAAPEGPEMKALRRMKSDWDRRFGLVLVG